MSEQQLAHLQQLVADLLQEAKQQGASAAEAGVHGHSGLDVNVRLGEIETIEHSNDQGLGVTVYFGQRKGSANTTDLRPDAVRETVAAACRIARYTSEDPYAGLADAELMAREIPDLDLNHPWPLDAEQAARIALDCEDAARAFDARINNSEGAALHTGNSLFVYGNSHGFVGGYPSTRHSLSCAVLAGAGERMQRDYWYASSRSAADLASAQSVGQRAAERTLARLNGRKIKTTECPVIFRADVAPSLLRSLYGAIRGQALYRKASFMLDQLGELIFPDWVNIDEDPLLPRGLSSAPFDSEGVATRRRKVVESGTLVSYALDSYSARKLGMQTTGNAGGLRNTCISSTGETFEQLLARMRTGLVVTELMGQGSNPVTGDYSRGAAGFWVEDGEIAFPVEEITVAGNLKKMFNDLLAIGCDDDIPGSVRTGSWLIERMTVAGD